MPDGTVMDFTRMPDINIIASYDFKTAPPFDVLLMSGGPGDLYLGEIKDRTIENFIASRFDTTEYILSVCTGAGFLARSGILAGRRATTNKAYWKDFTLQGANITWIPSARWVVDGKVWTSSGVTAGMDMMVSFLRHIYGDPNVVKSVNDFEYAPHVDADWDPFSVIHNVSWHCEIQLSLCNF
jgi:transcriptional regulator GlxA family with amidase domain